MRSKAIEKIQMRQGRQFGVLGMKNQWPEEAVLAGRTRNKKHNHIHTQNVEQCIFKDKSFLFFISFFLIEERCEGNENSVLSTVT